MKWKVKSDLLVASAAISVSLGFALPPALQSFEVLLGIRFVNSVITAIILLGTSAISVFLLLPELKRTSKLKSYACLFLTIFLGFYWFFQYFQEISYIDIRVTEFDIKRPGLFLHGFFMASIVGILASRNGHIFLDVLTDSLWKAALIVLVLYLLFYAVHGSETRLGGEASIYKAKVFATGIGALVAKKILYQARYIKVRFTLIQIVYVGMLLFAIALSGSRGPLIYSVISIALYLVFTKRFNILYWLTAGFLLVMLTVTVINMGWLPDSTIARLGNLMENGVDIRLRLIEQGFNAFMDKPWGVVTQHYEYFGNSGYSHNIIIQFLVEFGIPGLFVMAFYFVSGGRNLLLLTKHAFYPNAAFVVMFSIFMQSLSSGTLYQPLFWITFLLFINIDNTNSVNSNRLGDFRA